MGAGNSIRADVIYLRLESNPPAIIFHRELPLRSLKILGRFSGILWLFVGGAHGGGKMGGGGGRRIEGIPRC